MLKKYLDTLLSFFKTVFLLKKLNQFAALSKLYKTKFEAISKKKKKLKILLAKNIYGKKKKILITDVT
jgi:hypothetical protein